MKEKLDVLFIAPSNAAGIYQDLAKDYAGIEPPTWACLLAESCRSIGYKVNILDIGAENLSYEESLERIKPENYRFICFAVYGQNVNAGTTMMSGAVGLTNFYLMVYPYNNVIIASPPALLDNFASSLLQFGLNEGIGSGIGVEHFFVLTTSFGKPHLYNSDAPSDTSFILETNGLKFSIVFFAFNILSFSLKFKGVS